MTIPSQIKSLQHPIIKHCVLLRKDPSYRRERSTFLVMGKKEIQELPPSAKIVHFFSDSSYEGPSLCAKHFFLTDELFKKITGLVNPEPLVAEVEIPHLDLPKLNRLLICEEITDPGNLGTLFRTALAFGFDAIYLLGSTVDPYNDKVLRASRGALFHIPIIQGSFDDFIAFLNKKKLHLYQADLHGTTLTEFAPTLPFGLILGNEAKGTSLRVKKIAQAVTIPMTPSSESLNVAIAGGILMYNLSELCRNTKNI